MVTVMRNLKKLPAGPVLLIHHYIVMSSSISHEKGDLGYATVCVLIIYLYTGITYLLLLLIPLILAFSPLNSYVLV